MQADSVATLVAVVLFAPLGLAFAALALYMLVGLTMPLWAAWAWLLSWPAQMLCRRWGSVMRETATAMFEWWDEGLGEF